MDWQHQTAGTPHDPQAHAHTQITSSGLTDCTLQLTSVRSKVLSGGLLHARTQTRPLPAHTMRNDNNAMHTRSSACIRARSMNMQSPFFVFSSSQQHCAHRHTYTVTHKTNTKTFLGPMPGHQSKLDPQPSGHECYNQQTGKQKTAGWSVSQQASRSQSASAVGQSNQSVRKLRTSKKLCFLSFIAGEQESHANAAKGSTVTPVQIHTH